jgi:parallel beta-helix repeat protein
MKVVRDPFFVLLVLTIAFVGFVPLGIHVVKAETLQPHAPILIDGNGGFTHVNGITGGSGTVSDPYIIEGWEIASAPGPALRIQGTSAYFVIRNVNVHDSLAFSDFGAVDFSEVANGRLESATMSSNSGYAGVRIRFSANITVSQSRFESNQGMAIAVDFSQNVKVADNLVRSSLVGIFVGQGGRNVEVVGNDVSSNAYAGISVVYTSVVVSGNIVHDNGFGYPYDGYGIVTGRRCDCIIIENTVSNNRIGIVMSSGPSPFHNNLINNTVQAFAGCPYSGCVWTWDSGYPGGGNFWSDYGGVDNCSGPVQNVCPSPDGIGDTPYMMHIQPPQVLINNDRFPLMKPFAPSLSGKVRFEPSSIASQSNGGFLTATVRLANGFEGSDVILSSIRLNGTIAVANVALSQQSGQQQDHGGSVLVVKFNMTQVLSLMSKPGTYTLRVSGNLLTNTNFRPFEATATIRLLFPEDS